MPRRGRARACDACVRQPASIASLMHELPDCWLYLCVLWQRERPVVATASRLPLQPAPDLPSPRGLIYSTSIQVGGGAAAAALLQIMPAGGYDHLAGTALPRYY